MSNYSSAKRVQNDIAAREENSDRRIPPDMYYIVMIELNDDNPKISGVTKNLLKSKKEHQALVAYVYGSEIYLLFSSVEDKEHYLKGSHQAICSEYASIISMDLGCKTNVKIIELESRTGILVYFQTKVFESAKKSAILLSKNTITKKEVNQLTFGEIIPLLQQRASISWEKIQCGERFGTFYKYVVKDQKEKYITLAEMINMQESEKYNAYFFE